MVLKKISHVWTASPIKKWFQSDSSISFNPRSVVALGAGRKAATGNRTSSGNTAIPK